MQFSKADFMHESDSAIANRMMPPQRQFCWQYESHAGLPCSPYLESTADIRHHWLHKTLDAHGRLIRYSMRHALSIVTILGLPCRARSCLAQDRMMSPKTSASAG
jgi:hypothetical protein